MGSIEHPSGADAAVLAETLERLDELGIRTSWKAGAPNAGAVATGRLQLDIGDQTAELPAVLSASVSSTDLAFIPRTPQTILLTRYVSPGRIDGLQRLGWSGFVDTAGKASLRSRGLLIGNERGRRLLRRDLAADSGASIGTVNRVVRALCERTPPILDGKNRVLRPGTLEDGWVTAYAAMQRAAWPEERFTSDLWKDPSDRLEASLSDGALLGSELAAVRSGAPIRPVDLVSPSSLENPHFAESAAKTMVVIYEA